VVGTGSAPSVELVDGSEHRIDVRTAPTAALGTHRGGQGDAEGPYVLLGIGDETGRLGPDVAEQFGVPGARAWAAKASTRTLSGAARNWRMSQLTRVAGLPSFGASMSTWQVILPARRSVVMWSGPTVFGIRIAPLSTPLDASDVTSA